MEAEVSKMLQRTSSAVPLKPKLSIETKATLSPLDRSSLLIRQRFDVIRIELGMTGGKILKV